MITAGETYLSDNYLLKDEDGNPAAATVTVLVTLPNDSTDTPTVTSDELGTYAFNYATQIAGRHVFTVQATGGFLGSTVLSLGGDVFHVDEPATTAVQLVGLAETKAYLNIPESTADDEELRAAIVSASMRVEDETQLWHRRTVTQTLAPAPTLVLASLPVLSVTSVTQGGVTTDAGLYEVQSGIIASPTGARLWPAGLGQVTVAYEAGVTAVPAVIREAVLVTVKALWRAQRGASRLPLQGGDEQFAPPASLPLEALLLLRPYVQPAGVA